MEIKILPKTVEKPTPLEMLFILVYNITLLAGASYLVYYKDASAWLYFIALCFGASWKSEKEKEW